MTALDEELAGWVRELLAGEAGLVEKQMFGGVSFLLDGHMAVAASGQGGLLVRVDPADSDAILASMAATRMIMNGRPMKGWLRVEADELRTKAEAAEWIHRGAAYARSLPPKQTQQRKAGRRASWR